MIDYLSVNVKINSLVGQPIAKYLYLSAFALRPRVNLPGQGHTYCSSWLIMCVCMSQKCYQVLMLRYRTTNSEN